MDIKWKNYSHLMTTKVIAFVVAVACFTGAIAAFVNVAVLNDGDFDIVYEDNYYQSRSYVREAEDLLRVLTRLLVEYKNEAYIMQGKTVTEDEIKNEEDVLFSEFRGNSRSYDPDLGEEKNYERFRAEYAEKITQARERLIKDDLKEYNLLLQKLRGYKGILYFASDGSNVFTNYSYLGRELLNRYPSYIMAEKYETEIYPKEVTKNGHLHRITEKLDALEPESHVLYMAFTKELLNAKMKAWQADKAIAVYNLYWLAVSLLGLIMTFAYLVFVIGRKTFGDRELHLNPADRLYNDINIVLCIGLMVLWVGVLEDMDFDNIHKLIIPVTIPIASAGLMLILSMVKHIKNKTFLRHTFVYSIIHGVIRFARGVYDSGSVGIKTVLLVVGYPFIVALTFFMFPITIGAAAWLAHKRIKSFNAIKEGVERIKSGDIHHIIAVDGKGEFGGLAANINSITDGLKKAVDSELKSERLKTELITNVSHDIRTPLTSIITYVDLLKKEKDPEKAAEYIEVLDQKSQRLKTLTDDLFEAAKASSGNIPVNFERIDIVSLLTQGLGELHDKIEAVDLEFRITHPKQPVYIAADGKLLWRAVENLLSNIFKYALRGSRVYIDIEDSSHEILLVIKNISAYELNISADELMERFKRGDEARNSQGSGLGLSIAKSLIDIQRGRFSIQIDGDLFKAMIYMPKHKEINM